MSDKFEFELFDGLTVGEGDQAATHTTVEFKSLTAGEIFNAQDAAEELRATPNGTELITSPTKLSRNLMRLSIKRIGDMDGIGEASLRKISGRDYQLLMDKYNKFDGMQHALMQKRLKEAEDVGKS